MHVFLVGVPLCCGGANQEAGDTVLLWRRAGIEVSCLYFTRCRCNGNTAKPLPSNPWMQRLTDAGVDFVPVESGKLADVPGLPGSIIVAFCNQHAVHSAGEFAAIGCKLIWSCCMSYVPSHENQGFIANPPAACHFQSSFQEGQIRPTYEAWGVKRFTRIHSAFEPLPFRPRSRAEGEPFWVGRLARPCRTKWSAELWAMLGAVRRLGIDLRFIGMGWSDELTRHCGPPPSWADVYAPDHLSASAFLARCHALVCPNWGVFENWPRVGLEAMSAGVPVIADRAGGWLELLDRDSCILCNTSADYTAALAELAQSDPARQRLITAGRQRVQVLSHPAPIAAAWLGLLRGLQQAPR